MSAAQWLRRWAVGTLALVGVGCGDLEVGVPGSGPESAEVSQVGLDRSAFKRMAPEARRDAPQIGRVPATGREKPKREPTPAQPSARQRMAFEAGSAPQAHWSPDAPADDHRPADPQQDFAQATPEERFQEGPGAGPPMDDCLVCGRETGFLGAPELTVVVRADKSVELSWTEVSGADDYLVTALATREDGEHISVSRHLWRTPHTRLTLRLPDHLLYSFSVQARQEEPKLRSEPSNVVEISL